MERLCLAALLIISGSLYAESAYLITSTHVLRVGTTHKLSVTLSKDEAQWNIIANLTMKKSKALVASSSKLFRGGTPGELELKIPSHLKFKENRKNALLSVQGFEVGSGKTFTEKPKPVTLKRDKAVLFIQTDKPIYKPGQKIRMRVIATQPDLKPIKGKISQMTMANPSGVRMMQWKNVQFDQGIASLDFNLSSQPVLGKWKIEAKVQGNKISQEVEVAKYVLPKFEVTIQPPSFIAIDSPEVVSTFCASYTYGQPVAGKLKVTFYLKNQWWWSKNRIHASITEERKIKGCEDIKLTNKELKLKDVKYSYYGLSLHINATVTETATGVSRNASSTSAQVVPYRVKMNFHQGTPRHYKPGLPFYGQLIVTSPDGTPLSGETVKISAHTNKRKLFFKDFKVTNGLVRFAIDDIDPTARYLSIDARHITGGNTKAARDWWSSAGIHCTPWYSPSWSFISLNKIRKSLPVGSTAHVKFQYTLQKQPHTADFHYHVISGGKLVYSGTKTITSTKKGISTSPTSPTTDDVTQSPTTADVTQSPTTNDVTQSPTTRDVTQTPTTRDVTQSPTTSDKGPVAGAGSGGRSRRSRGPPGTSHYRKRKQHKPPKDIIAASGSIKFKVTQEMMPSIKVLVFYIRDPESTKTNETVADSTEVDIEDKLENQVSVRFNNSVRKPGQPVTIILSGARGSRVALSAVDKSVHLLRSANDLTEDKVMSYLKTRDIGPAYGYRRRRCGGWWHPWGRRPVPLRRQRRTIMPYGWSNEEDSSKAFHDIGVIYFSNLAIETKPCPDYRGRNIDLGPVAIPMTAGPQPEETVELSLRRGGGRPGPPAGGANRKKKPNQVKRAVPPVRTNFPETWLWTEETVSDKTGKKVLTAHVPDTITSWYASAFAMSTTHGIGVSSPASLTVFKPFFVSLTLPYSVIRGEQVSIISTVFNYMSRCITIRISLTRTDGFTLQSSDNQSVCVCANEAKSVKFVVTPVKLGRIPLTVQAADALPSKCQDPGEEARVGVVDTVLRKLLVEPEGVRREYTYSSFICPKDSEGIFSDRMKISLPKNIVDGSVYATLSTIGDLMGPSLSGLDGLLRLPTGCGEQNMVKFAPNIYIMRYLNTTHQLTGDVEETAVGYLRTGYQRELTYKRKNGSYSAFGNRDKQGSLWLTAFVLRSFAQARQFIYIDENELKATMQWILRKQLETGCFKPYGRLFNKALKGGVSSDVTLTAYVVISLIEAGLSPLHKAINKAMTCISSKKNTVTDSYSNAILAYAHTITAHADRGEFIKRLKSKAIQKDGLMYWEKKESSAKKSGPRFWSPPYHRARATNIEMTSYALMALIGDGSDSNVLAEVLPVVRWLTQQRNALGGFSSTQDTCVALQALSLYAGLVYGDRARMRIDVGSPSGNFFHQFRVTENNRLVMQRVRIPSDLLPASIPIDAFGEGCALVQADVSYNIHEVEEEPAFHFKVSVDRRTSKSLASGEVSEAGEELCQPLELSICARWLKEDASNMAVIEAKLVSGFEADDESLDRLTNRHDLGLRRYETEANKVILYFDEIKSDGVCFKFGINQVNVVKNTKPATVTVYDYYETELSATTSYNITEELCTPQEPSKPTIPPPPPPPRCPVCADQVSPAKLTRLCNAKTAIVIRVMKDGKVRMFEHSGDVAALAAGKRPDKKYVNIDVLLPKDCECAPLDPRSKAVIVFKNKMNKKKLRKLTLDDQTMVIPRKTLSSKLVAQCALP